jgi:hypothetical protein
MPEEWGLEHRREDPREHDQTAGESDDPAIAPQGDGSSECGEQQQLQTSAFLTALIVSFVRGTATSRRAPSAEHTGCMIRLYAYHDAGGVPSLPCRELPSAAA